MSKATKNTPEDRASKRVKNFTGLMWHIATFVIVNGMMWALDIAKGDGLNWAFWLTIFWGVGLAFHVAAYFLDERGFQRRRYQRFLAEEQKRKTGNPA